MDLLKPDLIPASNVTQGCAKEDETTSSTRMKRGQSKETRRSRVAGKNDKDSLLSAYKVAPALLVVICWPSAFGKWKETLALLLDPTGVCSGEKY